MKQRAWFEVNIENIKHNYNVIKDITKGSMICPVIKDNAYGHGALYLAKIYEELNCDYFAVSNIKEASELRQGGIKKPILILGYTSSDYAKELSLNNITQCVYSLDYAKELNDSGYKIKCHLKVDTGMNRLGFKDVDEMIETYNLNNLEFEGIFTHFAKTSDKEFTKQQYDLFMDTIDKLNDNGCSFKIKHCCNSGGTFEYPEYHLDMVRPGLVLYGLGYPGLKQALLLKTVITELNTIEAGETVGYERNFKAAKQTKVATTAIGYGDGFFRANSSKNNVEVNFKECPIIGNICMDQMMIDVTDVDCKVGDEVTIYKDLEKCANNIGTISYELIFGLDYRVPIIYK